MAGDSKAAGACMEAGGMSSVHFTAMQGVVLWGQGKGMPLLKHTELKNNII